MAIGIAIGVATMVVLFVAFIVAMSGMGGMPAMIAFRVALVATEPWSRFLPGTFFNFLAGICINGLILGVVLGVIFKMRQSRDA